MVGHSSRIGTIIKLPSLSFIDAKEFFEKWIMYRYLLLVTMIRNKKMTPVRIPTGVSFFLCFYVSLKPNQYFHFPAAAANEPILFIKG